MAAAPSPQERIQNDLKQAMKARDAERTSTLRMLLAELKNERIKLGHEVGEEEFVRVLQRGVKQRQDSVEQYRQGGREDLASKEDREAQLLATYLPEQVPEEEVRRAIEEVVRAEGLAGPAGIGAVMKAVLPRFQGRIDGKTVQRLAREVLGA
jgi:uncharacterized protein YqeY